MGTAKADHKAIDTDIHLETDNASLIKIDSDTWFQWLEENTSFKFTAGFGGKDSYRARKEVLGGVVYWYAFKKVNGKLHKRYIGKPHEVTHNRLCEVAKSIRDVKVKSAKEDKINNDSNQIGNTNLQGIVNQLVNQVQELSNRLDNLESKGDDINEKKPEYLPSEELETKIQELTNELTNKDSKLHELTIQLHKVKIEAKAAKNDATLLNQEVQRLTSELDSKNSKLIELTNELANKDSQLKELTNNIANLNSKLAELTNELSNKDRELQELKSISPTPVPIPPISEQLPTNNEQLMEQGTENGELETISPVHPQLTTDDGQFTEDVESDRDSTENSSMTEEQIIALFGLESIVTGTRYTKDSLRDDGILDRFAQNQEVLSNLGIKYQKGTTPVNSILKKLNFTVTQHKDKRTYHVGEE